MHVCDVCTTLSRVHLTRAAAAAAALAQILPLPPMLLRVLRVLRILRILRLLKGAKELRNLIMTMVLSFPSLINVGSMLALITFIYAVLGMNLFCFIAEVGALVEPRNFANVGNSFQLLYQCLTIDGWSQLMIDTRRSPGEGGCDPDATPTDCGTRQANATKPAQARQEETRDDGRPSTLRLTTTPRPCRPLPSCALCLFLYLRRLARRLRLLLLRSRRTVGRKPLELRANHSDHHGELEADLRLVKHGVADRV